MSGPPLTRQQLDEIYRNAWDRGEAPDLFGRDISEQNLVAFSFRGPAPNQYGFFANLIRTDFRSSDMSNCELRKTDLAGANLRGTKLCGADLRETNLYNAMLSGADLSGADLRFANLYSAELADLKFAGATFDGARFGRTKIAGVDLSKVSGLEAAVHVTPSAFSADALRLTAEGLSRADPDTVRNVLAFLGNAGMDDDLLETFRLRIGKPIAYHSVFLSHSSLDKTFARKLYETLRGVGIKCWFDERQLMPGDVILDTIDQGVRLWDKLILVCSHSSLDTRTGWWVEQEVERALRKEREERASSGIRKTVLIPVTIDDHVFADSNPLSTTLLQRYVGDFRKWNQSLEYARAFETLVQALKANR